MARPLRLMFPGAVYHITSRSNAREPIFTDDWDRRSFVEIFAKEVEQQRWHCYAWCLMDNHYHLLFETPEPNLVGGMRRLNQVYTQSFNRRHRQPRPEDMISAVADVFEVPPDAVLDRSNQSAFKVTVYLLRRACNLSLRKVARLGGGVPVTDFANTDGTGEGRATRDG